MRSCALGEGSGCTNAAAGMLKEHPEDPCINRTFERVCDRGQDAWACTMFGNALVKRHDPSDRSRIKEVLGRSCKYGHDDAACRSAEAILRDLMQ